MSIDFAPAFFETDIAGFGFACACGNADTGVLAATYRGAEALRGNKAAQTISCGDLYCDDDRCADGSGYIRTIEAQARPTVNVSSLNAVHIIEVLGIERDEDGEIFGEEPAAAFLGRVLMALAISPSDEGIPAHELPRRVGTSGRPVGPRWTECGRHEGYTEDVLARLHEVATWAAEHGRLVQWG